jgi:LacI family transcriptional regulator
LVTEFLTVDDLEPAVEAGMLIAATDHRLDASGVDLVSEDLVAGAVGAVEHLLELGHRRIAHLAGERHSTVAAGRLEGYLVALERLGIERDDDLIVDGPFTREAGEAGVRRLLARSELPMAIFAANDAIAIGALHELAEAGVRVPEDVAVVGVDNTPEAAVVRPGLTTMDVHPTEVGEALVDALLSRRDSGRRHAPLRRMVTPSLVRRGST